MSKDPTADEMRAFLVSQGCDDEFAREEAIYWFANFWHGGQWSNLYSALSTSEYRPGPITRGPEDSFWLDTLEAEYAAQTEAA